MTTTPPPFSPKSARTKRCRVEDDAQEDETYEDMICNEYDARHLEQYLQLLQTHRRHQTPERVDPGDPGDCEMEGKWLLNVIFNNLDLIIALKQPVPPRLFAPDTRAAIRFRLRTVRGKLRMIGDLFLSSTDPSYIREIFPTFLRFVQVVKQTTKALFFNHLLPPPPPPPSPAHRPDDACFKSQMLALFRTMLEAYRAEQERIVVDSSFYSYFDKLN